MERERLAISAARRTLEHSTSLPVDEEDLEPRRGSVDALFRLGDTRFAVEVKSNARSATVAQAITQLRDYEKNNPEVALLLVVPYMGEVGAEICERAHVNWVDLQGNASVHAERAHVYIRGKHVDGTAAAFLWPETGINPFSRKASRITHALLTQPRKAWSRAELEALTRLDKGYVSKIVAALSERGYTKQVISAVPTAIQVVDPTLLLDAWRERYKPEPPTSWGLVAARDGSETARKVAESLSDAGVAYAITGLGAAAHYTTFGSFRRVDVYIAKELPSSAASRLRTGTGERGRNVALYLDSANTSIGVVGDEPTRLASPVLTYLDLLHLPERSSEAAEEMRRYLDQQWK